MIITPDSPAFHQTRPNAEAELRAELAKRIMVIDGAMGTTIRTYGLDEADTRGERFKDDEKDLLNNGDIFRSRSPDVIGDIHRRFLEAGADIIETNTFSGTSIAQSEFFVEDPRREEAAARTRSSTRRSSRTSSSTTSPGRSIRVRQPVPRVGGSRRQQDRPQTLRRRRDRAADGLALATPRTRTTPASAWSPSTR